MALLLFGGKKLPEMMRGLGQGVREFKKGVNDVKEEDKDKDAEDNPQEEEAQEEQDPLTSDSKQGKTDGPK